MSDLLTVHAATQSDAPAVIDDRGVGGSTLDVAACAESVRDRLAHHEVPRSVAWVVELPTTGSGKILKRQLRRPCRVDRGSHV